MESTSETRKLAYRTLSWLFTLLLVTTSVCVAANLTVCEGVALKEKLEPALTKNEKAFICPSSSSNTGWADIPFKQKRFHFVRILQNRAHLSPSFKPLENGGILVDPGPITKTKGVNLQFLDGEIKLQLPWTWVGRPLTPTLLDEIEQTLFSRLYDKGFACTQVQVSVPNPKTSIVLVEIRKGQLILFRHELFTLDRQLGALYSPTLLSRHFAFLDNEVLNEQDLQLTASRFETAGLTSSAYFVPRCKKSRLSKIELRGSVAPPRLLRIGVGIDTEGIFKTRIIWRHSRFAANASPLEIMALGSFYRQQIAGQLRWFVFSEHPRFHLWQKVALTRENEEHFERYSASISLLPSTTLETTSGQITLSLGVTLEQDRTVRGPEKGDFSLPMLDFRLGFLSHDLEFRLGNPINGTLLEFEVLAASQALLSTSTVTSIQLSGKHLWNIGGFTPPKFILGLRLGVGTTTHGNGPLPPVFRYYLGGSETLRGYSRLEIPHGGEGAMSTLYAGIEGRLPSLLPYQLEPLLFVDYGLLGQNSFTWKRPHYLSPGFGLRWNSPIGVFRATLARGFVYGVPSNRTAVSPHWQFYLGYGESF